MALVRQTPQEERLHFLCACLRLGIPQGALKGRSRAGAAPSQGEGHYLRVLVRLAGTGLLAAVEVRQASTREGLQGARGEKATAQG